MAPPIDSAAAQAAFAIGAEALLDACDAETVTPVPGGGNNRLFKVEAFDGAAYALKTYATAHDDGAERLDAEFRALLFVWSHGLRSVPRPFAIDTSSGCALYDWIEGGPPGRPRTDDIDHALDFVSALCALSVAPDAAFLPPAREACFSGAEIVRQVAARRHRLGQAAPRPPALASFLEGLFDPSWQAACREVRADAAASGIDFIGPLESRLCTLSPSDFGFHNTVRRIDGSLAFLDFEYFGWDDPVKLVSDFLLHPGMSLEAGLRRRFLSGAQAIFSGNRDFGARLRLYYPLFAYRWCLILLNEFLPERWERRALAGRESREEASARQLEKARRMLALAHDSGGGLPHDA